MTLSASGVNLMSPPMEMVGTGRFELPTCRLGGDRSIHLSYVPTCLSLYIGAS
jgi:hypothetical protein